MALIRHHYVSEFQRASRPLIVILKMMRSRKGALHLVCDFIDPSDRQLAQSYF
jgi:hypothetical protein